MIYFIQESEIPHRIKIGYSKTAHARIQKISAGFSQHMVVLKVIEGTKEDESWLHEYLKEFRVDGKREWYFPDPNLLDFINSDKALSACG